MKIVEWFKLPETKHSEDIDDPATTLLHAEIIQNKPFLRKLYVDFYKEFRKTVSEPQNKVLVEIGSGGGFIKEIIGNVITSDILALPNADKVFSALDMPFEDASVDAFFMFDVLHHLAAPRVFFLEALRCLRKFGKIVMIEPANTLWSSFIYKNFHHEPFDTQADWDLKQKKPLSCANSAIAWIIFSRDRRIFEREFPSLKILRIHYHTPLRYLLSGGFTLRQLAPSLSCPVFKAIEAVLSPFSNLLGMFETIELEKVN